MDSLEASSRYKSEFLAMMSHEIRTPMNAILGMAELAMREKELPPRAREHVLTIRKSGAILLSIINDILDFSKIDSGKLEIVPADYRFMSLIKDVTSIIGIKVADSQIEFRVDVEKDIPPVLFGDEARIRQIILNLLGNAVKYTSKGFVTLTVSGQRIDDEVVNITIEVADSGRGIRPEDISKLFKDFVQIDLVKNKGIEGTGLGLAITHSLVKAMGGAINVRSEYGKGSVFTGMLPQKIGRQDGFVDETSAAALFKAPTVKALVVDDVPTNLAVAQGLLSIYEIGVDTCPGGAEAIEAVAVRDYDIVFMDHMMPGMDGIEATAAIRALEGEYYKKLPIIALTANAISGIREMFLENGFDDFLSKPIEIIKLNEILEKWVSKKNRQSVERQAKNSKSKDQKAALKLAAIEGIDISIGILRVGGSEERYRSLLEIFLHDAAERLALLETPQPDSMKTFTTHAHALKSALANIGALPLSEWSAKLEEAGQRGDISFISEHLDGFRTKLSSLCARIDKAIMKVCSCDTNNEEEAEDSRWDQEVARLRAALKAEDIDEIDESLAALRSLPLPPHGTRHGLVTKLAELVLMAEFGQALQLIEAR
jgi:CheY-like chemotaxis protein